MKINGKTPENASIQEVAAMLRNFEKYEREIAKLKAPWIAAQDRIMQEITDELRECLRSLRCPEEPA